MGLFSGQVALVTGASRGIGADIAVALATEGAAVAVTGRTEHAGQSALSGSLDETVADIRAVGGTGISVVADLARDTERTRLVDEVVTALGPIDLLVNNAAVSFFDPLAEFTEKRWRLMFEVQVRAPFELVQMVLPSMIERSAGRSGARPPGSFLSISSNAAAHPGPDGSRYVSDTVYGMTKAALDRFTTGLAADVERHGLTANVLKPTGVVRTPGVEHHASATPNLDRDEEPGWLMTAAAVALLSGVPRRLNGAVAYSQDLVRQLDLAETVAHSDSCAEGPHDIGSRRIHDSQAERRMPPQVASTISNRFGAR